LIEEDLVGDLVVKDVAFDDSTYASSAYQRWGGSTFPY
jgi:hypothetical protein